MKRTSHRGASIYQSRSKHFVSYLNRGSRMGYVQYLHIYFQAYLMAIGFIGDPTALEKGIGAEVKKKS